MYVFDKIDTIDFAPDVSDEVFSKEMDTKIIKRALFLLAAKGETDLVTDEERLKYSRLLEKAELKPELISYIEEDDFAYVWVKFDISFLGEFLK